MKRSFMFIGIMCLLGSLVFAGGGGQPAASSGGAKKTLKATGPGEFNMTGPNGTIDPVSGRQLPGYKMIVDEFMKQHPDVNVIVETLPWDNWIAGIQTAVLSGNVDVIIHGASLPHFAEPLEPYIAKDPEWASKRVIFAYRRSEAIGPLTNFYITGIPVQLAAEIVYINKEIMAHYNLKLPDDKWTWDDFFNIAKTCTGKDPVTGQQTYGLQFLDSFSNNEIWKNLVTIGSGLGIEPLIQYGPTAKTSKVNYADANALKLWNAIDELGKYTSPKDREGIDVSNSAKDFNIAMYFTEYPGASHDNLKAAGKLDLYYPQSLPRIISGPLKGEITFYPGDRNMAICNTSTQKDLAWEWIKFCTTDEVALRYYTQIGHIANNKDNIQNLNQLMSQNWVDAISRTIGKPQGELSLSTNSFTNNVSFGNLNPTLGAAMRMLLMGRGTVNEAADSVQKMVTDYIASIP